VLSRVTNVIDRRSSNRVLTRLRALLRSNEFYLIPLALVVGIVAGAIVTLMSEIAQIAHVLIFGIPIDVRLSANAYVNPVVALIAPASGGLLLGIMEWSRRRMKISSAVDPIEANALRGGRLSLRDSVVVSGQTLVSNGAGASVGLEAGYTQIGSGAASLLGQVLNLRRNDLRLVVGCGAAAAIAAPRMALRQGLIDRRHQLFVRQHRIGMRHPRFAQIIDFRRDQAVTEAQLRAPHLNHGAGLRRLRRGDGSSSGRSRS